MVFVGVAAWWLLGGSSLLVTFTLPFMVFVVVAAWWIRGGSPLLVMFTLPFMVFVGVAAWWIRERDEHRVSEVSACGPSCRVVLCRGAQDERGVSEASACGSLCGGWAGWDESSSICSLSLPLDATHTTHAHKTHKRHPGKHWKTVFREKRGS